VTSFGTWVVMAKPTIPMACPGTEQGVVQREVAIDGVNMTPSSSSPMKLSPVNLSNPIISPMTKTPYHETVNSAGQKKWISLLYSSF
jgi:hypothetical protein